MPSPHSRMSYVSTLCPVVLCPHAHVCTSHSGHPEFETTTERFHRQAAADTLTYHTCSFLSPLISLVIVSPAPLPELWYSCPYPCPNKFYKLLAVLYCYTTLLYKLSWAWAWAWMSQPIAHYLCVYFPMFIACLSSRAVYSRLPLVKQARRQQLVAPTHCTHCIHHTGLYYTMLYCTNLYYAILYYAMLYHAMLCYTIPFCSQVLASRLTQCARCCNRRMGSGMWIGVVAPAIANTVTVVDFHLGLGLGLGPLSESASASPNVGVEVLNWLQVFRCYVRQVCNIAYAAMSVNYCLSKHTMYN